MKVTGKIVFDPVNRTTKHNKQSSWKKVAMLKFDCDMDHYYSWFILKRYNLRLDSPLRGPHITFVNDKWSGGDEKWDKIKEKYNGKKVTIELNLDARSDGNHWWLIVDNDSRKPLHDIREELGLKRRPFFGLHMSIGRANEKNLAHSNYILRNIRSGLITT